MQNWTEYKMKITKKEVEHVARLGRLELSEEEKEKFTSQLEGILNYVGQLEKLDTQNIKPTSYAIWQNTSKGLAIGREDVRKESSKELRENLLNNAPHRDGNFFRVKKVIDND